MSDAADPHRDQPLVTAGAPLSDSSLAVIMVHGRNAGPQNILDLVPWIARPRCSYLAPSAAGRTWYPYSFMADRATNEPGLSSGLNALGRLVQDIVARGLPSRRILLLGFSQGACLTAEFAFRHPGRYGGVIVFSGGLIGPPGTAWNVAPVADPRVNGPLAGLPVFFGCSDVDAHVPSVRVEESASVFERMGAAVTTRIYPGMGHLVNDDEIAVAQTMIDDAARGV
jgi:predicted esterase